MYSRTHFASDDGQYQGLTNYLKYAMLLEGLISSQLQAMTAQHHEDLPHLHIGSDV